MARYLDVETVAERYGYSESWVYKLAEWGRLPNRKRPNSNRVLFPVADLDAFDEGAVELEFKKLKGGGRIVRPAGTERVSAGGS
jgi:predicted DNA-binding transcriptional regulator AlpA